MSISISDLALSNIVWTNEYDWFPVARAIEKSVTGAPIIQATAQVSGRDINFMGGFVTKEQLDELIDLTAEAGPHLLTLSDGRTVDVQFRDPPLLAEQVFPESKPLATDLYRLVALNLVTVGPMNPAPAP